MKIQVLILLFLSLFLLSAATPSDGNIKLIVDKEVIVTTVDSGASADIFDSVSYDSTEATLEFRSCEKISMIRIFDSTGQLEFQLPVMSKKVKLSKSLFGEGEYMLGFLIDGVEEVHLTHVNFL